MWFSYIQIKKKLDDEAVVWAGFSISKRETEKRRYADEHDGKEWGSG